MFDCSPPRLSLRSIIKDVILLLFKLSNSTLNSSYELNVNSLSFIYPIFSLSSSNIMDVTFLNSEVCKFSSNSKIFPSLSTYTV